MAFPHGFKVWHPPPPYPYENHAPSQFSCCKHSWLGYLIKDAYLHDDKKYIPYTTIDHRQRFHSPKHNTTKLVVGLLPLAPHHNSSQYIHHVHLMQQGQNQGVTFPSPFNSTTLSALQNLNKMLQWYHLGVPQN